MLRRLNHAVLYVRDVGISVPFYERVLGLEVVEEVSIGVFLKAPGSGNSHDLALFGVGAAAGPSDAGRTVGMYHLAWEVDTLAELVDVRTRLEAEGAFVGASDHGLTKSLYAHDPDGLEFEVLWEVPADALDPDLRFDAILPLDLDAEIARFGAELTRNAP